MQWFLAINLTIWDKETEMRNINLQNEIIDILTDENTNFKDIVVALAKRNPEILYGIVRGDKRAAFEEYIYKNYNTKEYKVPGVKCIRDMYPDMGLKEAVDYFNDILNRFAQKEN